MNERARIGLRLIGLAMLASLIAPAAMASDADRFSLDDAYREILSPQRARICLNGLWQFHPAQDATAGAPPTNGWASLRVPGRWNAEPVAYGGFAVRNDKGEILRDWNGTAFANVASAWYQRELTVPADWAGRHITVRIEHVGVGVDERVMNYVAGNVRDESPRKNTVIIVNGQRAKFEDDWTADISALVRVGAPTTLTIGVKSPGNSRWGRGINGDVWLESSPTVRISDLAWGTTLADHKLSVRVLVRNDSTRFADLHFHASLNGKLLAESSAAAAQPNGQAEMTLSATAPTLASWSEFDPQLTPLRLELVDGTTIVDTFDAKIGMRDWRVENGGIALNGRIVHLRTESGPTLGYGMEVFDRAFMRNYLTAYRDAHYNGLRSYWGLVPDYVYDLTDELGLMVQVIVPSPAMFRARSGIKDDAQFWPAYKAELAQLIAPTRRHVSVVAYDLWAHEASDRLQNQSANIDGAWAPQIHLRDRDRMEITKAVDLLRQLDPSREVLLDESNSLGKMVDVHPYFDFSMPLQEWEDWPGARAAHSTKPLNAAEFGLPYVGSWNEWDSLNWAMQDGHAFVIENAARYLGDKAYLQSPSAMQPADWSGRGMGYVQGTAMDAVASVTDRGITHYRPSPVGEEVAAEFATGVYRAWRTAGINLGPFAFDEQTSANSLFRPMDATLASSAVSLKTPGPKPDQIIRNTSSYIQTALPVASAALSAAGQPGFDPTKVFAATKAAFEPVLVYVGGDSDQGVTNKDHAFGSGEALGKSIVVVNDGPANLDVAVRWSLELSAGGKVLTSGTANVSAPQGHTAIVPIRMTVPTVADRTDARLSIVAAAAGKEIGKDSLDLQFFPDKTAPMQIAAGRKIGLYDKSGETARALDAMGITYRKVQSLSGTLDLDLLIIGAYSLDDSARVLEPLIAKGLNVLELEQRVGALSELAAHTSVIFDTTHMAATAARIAFPTDAASPVLAGLEAEDFANWRGSSDILPANAPANGTSYLYRPGGVEKIRGSNRGIVASFVLPKPQRGNFRVILSSGFDMGQTPLVEFMHGRGRMLVSQLDATRRYGKDPVATRLLRNEVAYMAADIKSDRKAVGFLGDSRGGGAIKALGIEAEDATAGFPASLSKFGTILVGEGGERLLRSGRDAVQSWVKGGGQLVLFDDVLGRVDPDLFPGFPSIERATLVKGRLPSGEPLVRGLSQSDTYFRAGLLLNRVALRGTHNDPAVVQIVHVGVGVIATLPIAFNMPPPIGLHVETAKIPSQADKLSRVVATVLTNAGVVLDAPFTVAPEIIDLAGSWRFKPDPSGSGFGNGWAKPEFNDGDWREINVPGFWAFQGVTQQPSKGGVGYDGIAWYRKTVTIPEAWKVGGPLSLVVGGIADKGEIFWNGKPIGHTADGNSLNTELSIPIDEAVVPYGGAATIAIGVADAGPVGGITGSVYLRKDGNWLTDTLPVVHGERYPNFEPDSYRYW